MKTIILKEHGILPNTDVTLALHALMCKNLTDTKFVFENADYYLSPQPEMQAPYFLSNSEPIEKRTLGIWMIGGKNCLLQGNGARIWCSGHMQPFAFDRCENIMVKGFVINWKKPMVAEGTIVAHTDKTVDVAIDSIAFPHRFTGDWLEFDVGAGEWWPLCRHGLPQFDSTDRAIRRNTGDSFLPERVEKLQENVYRIFLGMETDIADGNIVVLRHNNRFHTAYFAERCKEMFVEDLVVHSCGGLGCLTQFCENVTYRGVHFIPDRASGRKIVSGRDDGIQAVGDRGTITVTGCTFMGLMDDPINVHGHTIVVEKVLDDRRLLCRYGHPDAKGFLYWGEKGDEIAFIERKTMCQMGKRLLESFEPQDTEHFILTTQTPMQQDWLDLVNNTDETVGLCLENWSNSPSFICTKNHFGSCRARGILLTSHAPALIAENYFDSAGAAILCSGDCSSWYESGEVNDLEIRNNVFSDRCLTSWYQHGEGIISLCPVIDAPSVKKPFHKNVYIHDNVFATADTPVLYGLACKNLRFENNRIYKSSSMDKWMDVDARIRLEFVSNSRIAGNDWVGKFDAKQIVSMKYCENIEIE